MRLLVVTNDYPPKPGGIQVFLKNLVDAYPGEVHVVAPADDRAEPDEVGVTRGSRRYMLPTQATLRTVLDAAEKFSPDALLFGAPHPLPLLSGRFKKELGVPIGVLSHGAEITIPGAIPGLRQILGRSLASADVRLAVSKFTAGYVEKLSGEPATLIGAGIEIETFTPSETTRENERPIVGCVSRFVPRKGQGRLIRAASMLNRDVEVMLVGRGRSEGKLRKLAERLDVPVRFEVDVPWSSLPGLYREMDVFCMPCKSRWGGLEVEGFGLVFLEASSSGIPVLAGDSGGSPETVLPGETGFIVSDVDAIVEGLELLLAERDSARRMGAAGRRFVEENFTWERVISRLYEGFAPYID